MDRLVLVKGTGDLASGVAYRLVRCGFPTIMTELPQPTVVRRTVAFAQAVFDGRTEVEGVRGRLVGSTSRSSSTARASSSSSPPPASCSASPSPR